jgi:hypothetical protein
MKLNTTVNRILQNPKAIKHMRNLTSKSVLSHTLEAAEAFVEHKTAILRQLIPLGKIRLK